MPANTKGVFYVKHLAHGIFAELLGARALDGKPPPRMVNPQVWPLYARRFERMFGSRPVAPAHKPV
jgi:D-3-phosphoglycerate dehydrogenase / 2-oxoglutarate reductase